MTELEVIYGFNELLEFKFHLLDELCLRLSGRDCCQRSLTDLWKSAYSETLGAEDHSSTSKIEILRDTPTLRQVQVEKKASDFSSIR